jgi:hypothetical protein
MVYNKKLENENKILNFLCLREFRLKSEFRLEICVNTSDKFLMILDTVKYLRECLKVYNQKLIISKLKNKKTYLETSYHKRQDACLKIYPSRSKQLANNLSDVIYIYFCNLPCLLQSFHCLLFKLQPFFEALQTDVSFFINFLCINYCFYCKSYYLLLLLVVWLTICVPHCIRNAKSACRFAKTS